MESRSHGDRGLGHKQPSGTCLPSCPFDHLENLEAMGIFEHLLTSSLHRSGSDSLCAFQAFSRDHVPSHYVKKVWPHSLHPLSPFGGHWFS